MSSLCVLVILYNRRIEEIASWKTFEQVSAENDVRIVVVDNSDDKLIVEHNRMFGLGDLNCYICNDGNLGLSRSYNKAIASIESDWYMLADHDTFFSREYFENVLCLIDGCHGLICGMIEANGSPFSPARSNPLFARKIEFISEPGDYKNIYAVNSGLVVRRELLMKANGFDEKLFLDLVDYNLMNRLIEQGLNHFIVVPGAITQSFSANDGKSIIEAMPRYKMFSRDVFAYCDINHHSKLTAYLILAKRFLGIVRTAIRSHRAIWGN